MSLADRLEGLDPPRSGRPCSVGSVLARLPEGDRVALVAALSVPKDDPRRLSNRQISEALKSEGFDIHTKTVETHRKGACRCEPFG